MWYTLLLVLDVFLAWWLTSLIINWAIFLTGIPRAEFQWPLVFLQDLGFPSQFVTLVSFLPNLLLFIGYMLIKLPESRTFRELAVWDWIRTRYFGIKVTWPVDEKTEKEHDNCHPHHKGRQVIYAVSPHGVYASATIFYFALNPLYSDVAIVTTSLLSWLPIAREFAALVGAIPANTLPIIEALDSGQSLVIVPEGLRGLLHPENPLEVLRKRRGFIRCAINSARKEHISIVPVYIEGQNEAYRVFNIWPWFQGLFLSRFYYPWPVIAFGAWGLFWPRPVPFEVRFGTPIRLIDLDYDAKRVSERFCGEIEQLRLHDK